jgi:hypothetical protein
MCIRRTAVIAALAVLLVAAQATSADRATRGARGKRAAGPATINDFSSPHFLLHTDLTAREANDLLRQLEAEQKLLAAYWGRQPSGVLECYIAKNFAAWPQQVTSHMEPGGVAKLEEGAGVCIATILSTSDRFLAKSHLYAVAKDNLGEQVPLHEAVHGYCQQTFGRTGPRWYAEGMAEIGHYWAAGHKGVHVPEIVIRYLHKAEPRDIAKLIVDDETTGGKWEDYCWWWALCYMLENNPNYTKQFRLLGNAVLSGKHVTFQQTFAAQAEEMSFEFKLFIQHLQNGYRVDLCAIDWSRKFTGLPPNSPRVFSTPIAAGHGWQPTGLTVSEGVAYAYSAAGTWRPGKNAAAVNADGNDKGEGRLVGMIVSDAAPGEEFELGEAGDFTAKTSGNLYLRCNTPWNQLGTASGRITVKVHHKGKESSSPAAKKHAEKTADEKPAEKT